MRQVSPRSKLTNLEYLALQIFLRPDQSGRFYLGKLHQYRRPREHKAHPVSNWGASYFTPSGRYFGVLWYDVATCEIPFSSVTCKGNRPSDPRGYYLRPVSSEWRLFPAGVKLAARAARKLGLVIKGLEIVGVGLDEVDDPKAYINLKPKRVTKKSQLLDWWRSQPEMKATRVDLMRQYEIISGWRDEKGRLVSHGKGWCHQPCRYTSMTIGPIAESCGHLTGVKAPSMTTGNLSDVYELDSDHWQS